MKNLRLSKRDNKKKIIKRLLDIKDDLRDHFLRQYFHMCKEKAATKFLEWRMMQGDLLKVQGMKKIIRNARLFSAVKYDTEYVIY